MTVARFAAALAAVDVPALNSLLGAAVRCEVPQTGDVLHTRAELLARLAAYNGPPLVVLDVYETTEGGVIHGRWGDEPVVALLRLADGTIVSITEYWPRPQSARPLLPTPTVDIDALAARYGATVVPPCAVCGAALSPSEVVLGRTVYRHTDPPGESVDEVRAHERASVHVHRPGDPDVLAALEELGRFRAALNSVEAETAAVEAGWKATVDFVDGTSDEPPTETVVVGAALAKLREVAGLVEE